MKGTMMPKTEYVFPTPKREDRLLSYLLPIALVVGPIVASIVVVGFLAFILDVVIWMVS